VLGPLEEEEYVVVRDTVVRNLDTHRRRETSELLGNPKRQDLRRSVNSSRRGEA
jgi:hypothetical protein